MAVLTVIEQEFDAVQQELQAYEPVGDTGAFAPAPSASSPEKYPFVLGQCANRSNGPAQGSTLRLIEHFRPEVVLLVGIAGGIQRLDAAGDRLCWKGDALPGDVVLGDYVHYADFTKNEDGLEKLRYFALDHPSEILVEGHFNAVRTMDRRGSAWHAGLDGRPEPIACRDAPDVEEPKQRAEPRLIRGEIIAVEGLAGDPQNQHQITLINRFDHAVAIDMESKGVARALHEVRDNVHYNPVWMCVRGISDAARALPPDRDDVSLPSVEANAEERRRWTKYSATAAARVARHLLALLLQEARDPHPEDPGAPAYDSGKGEENVGA